MIVFGAVDSLARSADADDTRSIDARRVDALMISAPYGGPSAVASGGAPLAAGGQRAAGPLAAVTVADQHPGGRPGEQCCSAWTISFAEGWLRPDRR